MLVMVDPQLYDISTLLPKHIQQTSTNLQDFKKCDFWALFKVGTFEALLCGYWGLYPSGKIKKAPPPRFQQTLLFGLGNQKLLKNYLILQTQMKLLLMVDSSQNLQSCLNFMRINIRTNL